MQHENKAFHCKFCAPDAAVTQLYWGEYAILSSFHCQYFLDSFSSLQQEDVSFHCIGGLFAPVTPVTLSHLVPAIAINISLFQLCIYQ